MRVLNGRVRTNRRGASAAELAIILPVLMFIVLACIDFGRFGYHLIAVTNSARAGGSYAVMNPYTSSTQAAWRSQIQQAARDEMAGQTGYDPNRLTTATTVTVESNGLRRLIRIEATYDAFETLVSWPGIPDTIVLRRVVTMRAIR